eukprot:6178928-Pleurochrysis_carterae.AAC.2
MELSRRNCFRAVPHAREHFGRRCAEAKWSPASASGAYLGAVVVSREKESKETRMHGSPSGQRFARQSSAAVDSAAANAARARAARRRRARHRLCVCLFEADRQMAPCPAHAPCRDVGLLPAHRQASGAARGWRPPMAWEARALKCGRRRARARRARARARRGACACA